MNRSPRFWIPVVAALIAVIAAGTIASVLLRERSVRAERDELEAVSSDFTAALLSYDSGDLQAARTRMRPLATEKFFANYESTLEALGRVNSKAEGRAVEVLIGRPRGSRVTVVVITDSTAQTANGPRSNKGTYLRLDLLQTKDGWRVDQVLELAPGRSEGAEPPPED